MGKLNKLWGMAKESYQEQHDRDRVEESEDEIERRTDRIKEKGLDGLGRNGIFDSTEDVLAAAKLRSAPPQLSDDKVNRALGSLHDKLIDDDFVIDGEGDAQAWPVDVANALMVLTDRRLLVLRRGKTFTPDDILREYPIERVGDVSYDRSMKGNKLIIGFKDGSSATLPVDEPKIEIFKVKFDTRPVR